MIHTNHHSQGIKRTQIQKFEQKLFRSLSMFELV